MTDSNSLYYMRARFYSPEMRRFVNQDILLGFVEDGQTLNRYAFVTGNPVSYVDPFGLSLLSLERAVEIIKLFLPELYNTYASPSWGDIPKSGRRETAAYTEVSTGKITIDKTLNLFELFPSLQRWLEQQCGKLTPQQEKLFRPQALELLEKVIHEFMHSTIDHRFRQKHWLGGIYLAWDDIFYEMGFSGTWHGNIYQRSREFAEILVFLMFLNDEEFLRFEEVWKNPE